MRIRNKWLKNELSTVGSLMNATLIFSPETTFSLLNWLIDTALIWHFVQFREVKDVMVWETKSQYFFIHFTHAYIKVLFNMFFCFWHNYTVLFISFSTCVLQIVSFFWYTFWLCCKDPFSSFLYLILKILIFGTL